MSPFSPADTGLTVNGIAVGDVDAIEVFPGGYTLASTGDTYTFSKTKVVVEGLIASTNVYSIRVQLSAAHTEEDIEAAVTERTKAIIVNNGDFAFGQHDLFSHLTPPYRTA